MMSQHCKDTLKPTELIPFFDWFEHVPGELRQSNRRNAGSCHELGIHLPAAFRPLLGVIRYSEMKAWTVTGLCHDCRLPLSYCGLTPLCSPWQFLPRYVSSRTGTKQPSARLRALSRGLSADREECQWPD